MSSRFGQAKRKAWGGEPMAKLKKNPSKAGVSAASVKAMPARQWSVTAAEK
ncbi:hypothetical protein AB434_0010 [Heyndrickxia coagulans]|nr:hypothetical protein AB434_0010 [Heyndrickxia coagulans]